jgi:hypothetical protein
VEKGEELRNVEVCPHHARPYAAYARTHNPRFRAPGTSSARASAGGTSLGRCTEDLAGAELQLLCPPPSSQCLWAAWRMGPPDTGQMDQIREYITENCLTVTFCLICQLFLPNHSVTRLVSIYETYVKLSKNHHTHTRASFNTMRYKAGILRRG